MTTRDRDEAGRPHNARPRDGLGRPLPRGAEGGVEPVADRRLTPPEALVAGQDYFDREMPFHAHEVFEDQWKVAEPRFRELWQGLAQLAVALTHQRRGNLPGAGSLARRGAERIAPYAAEAPYDIDVTGLVTWAEGLARDPETEVAVPVLRKRD